MLWLCVVSCAARMAHDQWPCTCSAQQRQHRPGPQSARLANDHCTHLPPHKSLFRRALILIRQSRRVQTDDQDERSTVASGHCWPSGHRLAGTTPLIHYTAPRQSKWRAIQLTALPARRGNPQLSPSTAVCGTHNQLKRENGWARHLADDLSRWDVPGGRYRRWSGRQGHVAVLLRS